MNSTLAIVAATGAAVLGAAVWWVCVGCAYAAHRVRAYVLACTGADQPIDWDIVSDHIFMAVIWWPLLVVSDRRARRRDRESA